MESKYENLEKLNELYKKGVVSESEYLAEKSKILNRGSITSVSTDDDNKYSMLMHVSQFSDIILPGGGLIIPIVMWVSRKEKSFVDINGKIIMNWKISSMIYFIIGSLIAVFSGIISVPITDRTDNPLPVLSWVFGTIVFPLVIFGIIDLIFIIVGAVKASKGEVWNYPLSIRFFKTNNMSQTPKGEF